MMCFIVVCLFVFSIGSLQPLEVNAATEQKPSIPISSPPSPKSQTLGNSPSSVETRENDVISTPKPSLPYWKPLSTRSPPRKPTDSLQPTPPSPPIPQKPAPVPQTPERPIPKPSHPNSTSPGRKPTGPLPPPPPPPPQGPSSVPQTPKPSDSKRPLSEENEVGETNKASSFWGSFNKLFPCWKPKDPSSPTPPSIPQTPKLPTPKPAGPKHSFSAENEVGGKHKPFWKPWKELFPNSKPASPKAPLSAENEVGGKHKPFWKPWSKLFTTPKPTGPKPSLSAENEVEGGHKPFWKPWTKFFTTPKPECPKHECPKPECTKPECPKPECPKPSHSEENEVMKPQKPSPPFWDPLTRLFPTRKPKGPLPPTSPPVPQNPILPTPKPPVPTLPPLKSNELVFPTPKPLFPSKTPKPTVQKDKKPTDHPNDIDQRRDNGYGYGSEERTTKKSYLKEAVGKYWEMNVKAHHTDPGKKFIPKITDDEDEDWGTRREPVPFQ